MKCSINKVISALLVLCIPVCKSYGLSSGSPQSAADISITTNGLNSETITVTNNSHSNIRGITVPDISNTLGSTVSEDKAHSNCDNIQILPLTPGKSCAFVFTSNKNNLPPGIKTGTIHFTISFGDTSLQDVNLPTTVTNYLYAGSDLGVYRWDGSTWSILNHGPTKVTSLLIAPNGTGMNLYAGSITGNSGEDLQIWNGSDWTESSDSPIDVSTMLSAYDSKGNNTIYTGSDNPTESKEVNVLINGNWYALGNSKPQFTRIQVLAINNSIDGTLYAATTYNYNKGDIYHYDVSKKNWILSISSPRQVHALLFKNNNTLYAGSSGNMNSISDVNYYDGTAWNTLGRDAPNGVRTLALDPSGNLYAGSGDSFVWTKQDLTTPQSWSSVTASSDGIDIAAVVNGGDIWTSHDGGATWVDRISASSKTWSGIASSADGSHLAAVVHGGDIWTSADSGVSWTDQVSAGSRNWTGITSSADGLHLAAVMNDGFVYTSSNFGQTWKPQFSPKRQIWTSIASSADGSHLAATALGGDIWTSSDYGVTWTDQIAAGTQNWNSITSSADGSHLAAVVNIGKIWTSNDYGATWTEQNDAGYRYWHSITSSATGQYLAAVNQFSLYTSNDYGATWSGQSSAGNHPWSSIVTTSDGSHLYAVSGNSGSIYMGTPASNVNVYNNSSWQPVAGGNATPVNINALILDNASNIYTGSINSNSGSDINEYSNGAWTPLNSSGAPSNVTALTLGSEMQISSS